MNNQNKKQQDHLEKRQLEIECPTSHKIKKNPPEVKDPKRISYSELKNWVECPYRHKLIHKDKLPYFEGNEYTAFGTAIHKVCELLMIEEDADFEKEFIKELEKLKKDNYPINENMIEDMFSQGRKISKVVLPEVKKYFKDFTVFSIEEQILEEIKEFDSNTRYFKGFIDLVIKTNDGKYHVIDWKTCSWGWDSKKKNDKIINYQLSFYKNYFSKKHDIDPDDIFTYFVLLKRTSKKNIVEVVPVTNGKRKINNSLNLLICQTLHRFFFYRHMQ